MSESKKPTNSDSLEAAFNISTDTAAFEHSIAMGVKEHPNVAESAKQEPKLKGNIIESAPNLSTLEKFAKNIQEIRSAGLYKMIQGRIDNNFTHVWDGNSPTEASKPHVLSNNEADRTTSKLPLVRKKFEKLWNNLNDPDHEVNKGQLSLNRINSSVELSQDPKDKYIAILNALSNNRKLLELPRVEYKLFSKVLKQIYGRVAIKVLEAGGSLPDHQKKAVIKVIQEIISKM